MSGQGVGRRHPTFQERDEGRLGTGETDNPAAPVDNLEALFQFGHESRRELKDFVEAFPSEKWDVPFEFKLMNSVLRVTPKKIIVHVLVHEMRHWAQIATLLRLNG